MRVVGIALPPQVFNSRNQGCDNVDELRSIRYCGCCLLRIFSTRNTRFFDKENLPWKMKGGRLITVNSIDHAMKTMIATVAICLASTDDQCVDAADALRLHRNNTISEGFVHHGG